MIVANLRTRAAYLFERDERFILFGLPPGATSWRGVGMLAAVFFGSLAAVVVLTPLAYHLLELWAAAGSSWAEAFLRKGDVRFFSGLRWIVILICLPFIFRACRLTSLRTIGLPIGMPHAKVWAVWFATGLLLIVLLAGAQIIGGVTELKLGWTGLWKEIPLRFMQGYVGGLGEEVIFRGLILMAFYTATGRPWLALLLTSLFFAYTHFKVPDGIWAGTGRIERSQVGWFIAYWMLAGIGTGFDAQRFAGLFALGVVLGVLALRTGTLWASIGLHSGLVMGVLIYKAHYDLRANVDTSFWGGPGLIDGWAAVLAIAALITFLTITYSEAKKSLPDDEGTTTS